MTNALGAKPVVDTSEFKSRLREMNADLRVLESGFRASTASMGDWAQTGTGLEARIKSLNVQMDVQRQKVGLLRDEFERVKAEKGEDAAATKNAEVAYNKAVETLGKMEAELGQTESALAEMSEETEDSGSEAEEAGAKWEGFRSVLGGVGVVAKATVGMILGLVAGVAAVAAAVGGLVFSSAKAAAELVDLSAKTGISTTVLQEMKFVGEQVGVSLDTIASSQARLTRSMASAAEGTGEAAKAFETLEVSATNADGSLRDQQDVMADVLAALGGIDNAAERDALAMTIFGRGAMELNPLIGLTADELAAMKQEAHDLGAVMSEEDVAALETFDDTMSKLKLGIQGTLGTLATAFLPTFQLVFGKVSEYLERFVRIVDTFTNKGGGIANFTASMTGLVKGIATDIATNLPQMLESGLAILKTILDGIMQALPLILPAVIEVLLTLVDFIVQNLPIILDAALKIVTALTEGLAAAAPTLVPAIILLIGEILKILGGNLDLLMEAGAQLIVGIAQGLVNAVPKSAKDAIEAFLTELGLAIFVTFPALGPKIDLAFKTAVAKAGAGIKQAGKYIVEGFWKGVEDAWGWLYGKIKSFIDEIIAALLHEEGAKSPAKKFMPAGKFAVQGFVAGMFGEAENFDRQMSSLINGLSASPAFASAGGAAQGTSITNNDNSFSINGFHMPNGGPNTTIAEIMEFLNRRG